MRQRRWLAVWTEKGRGAAVSGGMGDQPLFGSLFKLLEGLLKGPLITFPAIRLADAPLTSRGSHLVNPKSGDSVSGLDL